MRRLSLVAFALSLSMSQAFAVGAIGRSGFKVMQESVVGMRLQYKSELSVIISKERFTRQREAEAFCKRQRSQLDQDFTAYLLAISGAADVNTFINEAISFEVKAEDRRISGIWSWKGRDNKVSIMYDAGDGRRQDIRFEDINKNFKISLPAICGLKIGTP